MKHVTVLYIGKLHVPVAVADHPNGYEQIADELPGETDALSAKREAVEWAKRLNLPFKVPNDQTPV